ncbi:CBS domain-containing protein [Cumulibacter soli]|uniref:CBS domain-containing protein n=1 Tax=Cumulibacter soli TaxID=2546344 RepID=UPI00106803D9|nr:CBS domain-containing protein [Cumulibacter soli]
MKISEILSTKGAEVVTMAPDATIRDLVDVMAQHNIGAVIVSADGEVIEGIVSERDVVRHLSDIPSLEGTPVRAIMTAVVQTTTLGNSVDGLRRQMTDARVRHVPVIEDGRMVGIVSIGDVVKSSIDELEFERDQLSKYVSQ